jgi:2-polyprenyl-6-hydroxyphenyl methylase/3-demethylubiquinone-9 3-methyltransferase
MDVSPETLTDRDATDELRFGFGGNWARFAEQIDETRIAASREALVEMLGTTDLSGKSFLDAGSGSGLSSLAAHSLGADSIHAFDFDLESVQTTEALRQRFAPDARWAVDQGDVLNREWLGALGEFDIVYSWGVLHHTGDLWRALDNVIDCVAPGGTLLIAVYNDQGRRSRRWLKIKRIYNRLPKILRWPFAVAVMAPMESRALVKSLLRGRPGEYFRPWAGRETQRGMSRWHDLLDWVGGYPFEVAKPEEVLAAGRARGLDLVRMRTVGGDLGCNEFVLERPST